MISNYKTNIFALLLCCFISFSKSQYRQQSTCITPIGDIGQCKDIMLCQPILHVVNRGHLSDALKREIQKYFCGFEGTITKVCCPNKTNPPQRDAGNLLPTENCGEAEALVRITNGEKADLLEFPWQAALKYVSRKPIPYSCGGSLINNRYVLTAAHCITPRLIGVRLGEYDFLSQLDCVKIRNVTTCAPPHQDFDITRSDALVHPQYRGSSLGYDIALIRLPREAIFNEAVKPICLPINQFLIPKSLTNLLVTGWGHTEYGEPTSVLLKVSVPYQANHICQNTAPVKIYDSQLCAGKLDGKDSCKGDSGGPIMTAINVDGRIKTVQVGLVSYGSPNCGEDYPGVYTRITSFTKWIMDNIKP